METDATPAAGIPAPYGRACTTCSRAKAKCLTTLSSGTKCERCHRLNKDCQPQMAIRKRRVVHNPSANKTARLEEKLDGLVTLLKAGQSIPVMNGNASRDQLPVESSELTGSGREHEKAFQVPIHGQTDCTKNLEVSGFVPPALVNLLSAKPKSPEDYVYSRSEPSIEQAEQFLDKFKTKMLEYMPFINLPPSTTALKLYHDSPFVFLSITAVACDSSLQQLKYGEEILRKLGQEAFVDGGRSPDILVGALIYLAWGHHYMYKKPVVTSLIQYSIGLLGDLGLTRLPPKGPPGVMLDLDLRGCPKPFGPSLRTLEERRIALGCFLISSLVSTFFQRIDAQRWTPYMDDCLQLLADHAEYPNDLLLIQLVRLQLIIDKAIQAPWHNGGSEEVKNMRTPSLFILKTLESCLRDFKRGIPQELQQNKILLLRLYSAELYVHESGFSTTVGFSGGPDFRKIESLYTCLDCTKSWFDLFLTINPADYLGFSLTIFTQLAYSLVILFRLSTFDDPNWDRELVHNTIALSSVLDQLVERMALVKTAAGFDHDSPEDTDIFSFVSRRFAFTKTWWETKLAAESAVSVPAVADETMAEVPVNLFDDAWVREMLGFGEHLFEPYA